MARIIRVFPRRTSMTPTDDYAFVGDPPMLRPEADEVHVSCAFTWDMAEVWRLQNAWSQYYEPVIIGGPAWDSYRPEFEPGLYVRPGVTFTTRGCNNQCPWCLAWKREGKLREIEIHAGSDILDNNVLQSSHGHWRNVVDMLRTQHSVRFSGGLDSRLLTDDIADDLRSLRVRCLFFACDSKEAIRPLAKAKVLLEAFTMEQLRAYVLIAYDGETILEAQERLEAVYNLGFMPFAMLYQPPDRHIDYSREWRKLAKEWTRPAITKGLHKARQ